MSLQFDDDFVLDETDLAVLNAVESTFNILSKNKSATDTSSIPSIPESKTTSSNKRSAEELVKREDVEVIDLTIIKKEKEIERLDYDRIVIFTDGSCDGNPGPGGWAGIIQFVKSDQIIKERIVTGYELDTTNNRMEMMAALKSLIYLDQSSPLPLTMPKYPDRIKVELFTDSNYLKNGITSWIIGWKKNKWKASTGEPVKNQDLWMAIDQLTSKGLQSSVYNINKEEVIGVSLESVLSYSIVQWTWVKAHAGQPENERVDKLAKAETTKALKEKGVEPKKRTYSTPFPYPKSKRPFQKSFQRSSSKPNEKRMDGGITNNISANPIAKTTPQKPAPKNNGEPRIKSTGSPIAKQGGRYRGKHKNKKAKVQ